MLGVLLPQHVVLSLEFTDLVARISFPKQSYASTLRVVLFHFDEARLPLRVRVAVAIERSQRGRYGCGGVAWRRQRRALSISVGGREETVSWVGWYSFWCWCWVYIQCYNSNLNE